MATQVSDTSNKSRIRSGSADDLAVIAQRAQSFTNASGTAIALSEGSMDEIVCRARAGNNAPEVGTSMRVQGSFTGLCIQSGKELRCDDVETDTRVDTTGLRALGIRSMVVIPIKDEGRVAGVLAVFAPTAHAFTITHVAVLKTMADQIAAILQRDRKTQDDGSPAEPHAAAPAALPKAVPVQPTAAAVAPAPVVIKSAPPTPVVRPPVMPKVEPVRASVMAAEIGRAPAGKKKQVDARHDEPETKTDYRMSFGTLDAAGAKKLGNQTLLIGAAAVIAVAAIGTFSYFKMHKPAESAVQQHEATNPAVPSSALVNSQPAAPSAANNITTPASAPAPVAPQPVASSDNSRRVERPVEKPSARNTAAAAPAKHEEVQARPEPEPKREETVALSSGPSRISSATETPSASPDAAPSIALGSAPASGSLSTLASPVSASTPSMVTQSELEPLKLLKRVPPIYPLVAKQRMLSGSVEVLGTVGVDGKIKDLKLVSGSPVFRDAAFDALKQWQYQPAKLNGKPIEQQTRIRLDFTPR